MAYLATILADEAGKQINRTVRSASNSCGELRAKSEAGAVSANLVLSLMSKLAGDVYTINTLKTTPGLAEFFRDAYDDPYYDPVLEFVPMLDAMRDVALEIKISFPTSINGYIEKDEIDEDGNIITRGFSTVGMAGVRAKIDVFQATVIVI